MSKGITSRRGIVTGAALMALLALAACQRGSIVGYSGTVQVPGGPIAREANRPDGDRSQLAAQNAQRSVGVNVNRFAWQAALDAVSFMPLRTSDPYGGIVATDWYTDPEIPGERVRVNVRVRGPELSSETVQATVFREVRTDQGGWEAAEVSGRTARDLENVILTRARALRIEAESAN